MLLLWIRAAGVLFFLWRDDVQICKALPLLRSRAKGRLSNRTSYSFPCVFKAVLYSVLRDDEIVYPLECRLPGSFSVIRLLRSPAEGETGGARGNAYGFHRGRDMVIQGSSYSCLVALNYVQKHPDHIKNPSQNGFCNTGSVARMRDFDRN